MNTIAFKKPIYKVKQPLRDHLKQFNRYVDFSISYDDLTNYQELIPSTKDNGELTLWYYVIYNSNELEFYQRELKKIYEMLVADGDEIPYLRIESIEFCSFGNSKPFRIKVINDVNDNHDYFYVKKADASRIYGLELEEIFSPNKVSFLASNDTLVVEHIVGIPGDEFINNNKKVKIENRLRLAKEFVKFNERCFVRLLGDMRAYNFIVEIIRDFDNVQYRLRAIDFDQQCYEARKNIYLSQYYKDNNDLVALAKEVLSEPMANQYMKEERVAMRKRFFISKQRTKSLLRKMRKDKISSLENTEKLRRDLAKYHKENRFLVCETMGDILTLHIQLKLNVEIF